MCLLLGLKGRKGVSWESKIGGIALRKLLGRLQGVDEEEAAQLTDFVGDAVVPGVNMSDGFAVRMKAYELLEDLGMYDGGSSATVSRFLNRILMMPEGEQNLVFNLFIGQLESVIADQKQAGTYDEGVVDLRASSIIQRGPPALIWKDEATEAKCECVTLTLDRGVSHEEALKVSFGFALQHMCVCARLPMQI